MKIAVTGKGGTGKSTVAGMLAHLFNNDGCTVLAVDADPDANLAAALGVPPDAAASIVPISQQRRLIRERTGANPGQFGQLFTMNPTVDDIPDRFVCDFRGIKLLVMGAVAKGGGGCACPENVLLKSLLSEIILNRREVVIVDMEAGIEHLGRGTAANIDMMLIVTEPGLRSVETAQSIMRLGREIGVPRFGIVANKVVNQGDERWLAERLPPELTLGTIPYHQAIRDADLSPMPLVDAIDDELKSRFKGIYAGLHARLGWAVSV